MMLLASKAKRGRGPALIVELQDEMHVITRSVATTVGAIGSGAPSLLSGEPVGKSHTLSDPGVTSPVVANTSHREMLDQVLHLFAIQPDYDLGIMVPGQTLSATTRKVLLGLEPLLQPFCPDLSSAVAITGAGRWMSGLTPIKWTRN